MCTGNHKLSRNRKQHVSVHFNCSSSPLCWHSFYSHHDLKCSLRSDLCLETFSKYCSHGFLDIVFFHCLIVFHLYKILRIY